MRISFDRIENYIWSIVENEIVEILLQTTFIDSKNFLSARIVRACEQCVKNSD